jgi:hypothetical protein
LKKNGKRYFLKWLHLETRDKEVVGRMDEYIDIFNKLLALRDTLYRINFNLENNREEY